MKHQHTPHTSFYTHTHTHSNLQHPPRIAIKGRLAPTHSAGENASRRVIFRGFERFRACHLAAVLQGPLCWSVFVADVAVAWAYKEIGGDTGFAVHGGTARSPVDLCRVFLPKNRTAFRPLLLLSRHAADAADCGQVTKGRGVGFGSELCLPPVPGVFALSCTRSWLYGPSIAASSRRRARRGPTITVSSRSARTMLIRGAGGSRRSAR